jgi:hypothetical protein
LTSFFLIAPNQYFSREIHASVHRGSPCHFLPGIAIFSNISYFIARFLGFALNLREFNDFFMPIQFATGLRSTMMSIALLTCVPLFRGTRLASFRDFASAPIRRRRCSINPSFKNPLQEPSTSFRSEKGSEEREPLHEKRNYHQFRLR